MGLAARRRPLSVLFFGLFIFWGFGFETVGKRLLIELDGTVVSSTDSPATGAPRYATKYVIRSLDGQDHMYTAGATDASLPRSMPIGTQLKKKRWQLSYMRNGQIVDDFPMISYSAVLGLALGLLVWSVILWRNGPDTGAIAVRLRTGS